MTAVVKVRVFDAEGRLVDPIESPLVERTEAEWRGPRPTGLRFSVNSESLGFTDRQDLGTLADPAASVARG